MRVRGFLLHQKTSFVPVKYPTLLCHAKILNSLPIFASKTRQKHSTQSNIRLEVKKPTSPIGIYLLKVNNRNIRTRCEICSKLATKRLERRHWRRSGAFIVNFENISHLVLVFLLLTLNTLF